MIGKAEPFDPRTAGAESNSQVLRRIAAAEVKVDDRLHAVENQRAQDLLALDARIKGLESKANNLELLIKTLPERTMKLLEKKLEGQEHSTLIVRRDGEIGLLGERETIAEIGRALVEEGDPFPGSPESIIVAIRSIRDRHSKLVEALGAAYRYMERAKAIAGIFKN